VEPLELVLRRVFEALRLPLRGSAFGMHLAMGARLVAKADFAAWPSRVGEGAGLDLRGLSSEPHRTFTGDADRATWRVPGGRIDLFPAAVGPAVGRLVEPRRPEGFPLLLRSSIRPDRSEPGRDGRDPGAGVHPSLGLQEGAVITVRSPWGSVASVARNDERLRPDTVDLPWGYGPDVAALYGPGWVDADSGSIIRDGHPCRVE
jgi:hypothetical protein